MARSTGIGGIFFKARDPQALADWYARHLGLPLNDQGNALLRWRAHDAPEKAGSTTWAPFPSGTDYFGPGGASFMINYRVDDLDGIVAQLRAAGVAVEDHVETSEYGRFAWARDPDGNRIELWQPAEGL